MGLKKDFDQAAKDALTLPPSTTNDDKLVLYGLFKSATVGKPETNRPGIFDPKILKMTQLKEAWDILLFASCVAYW